MILEDVYRLSTHVHIEINLGCLDTRAPLGVTLHDVHIISLGSIMDETWKIPFLSVFLVNILFNDLIQNDRINMNVSQSLY